jgi:hypothetical protein
MARMTTDQRLSNVHADALKSFNTIQSALRDERLQCLQDRRFYSINRCPVGRPIEQPV